MRYFIRAILVIILIGFALPGRPPASAQDAALTLWLRDDHPMNLEPLATYVQNEYRLSLAVKVMSWAEIRDRFREEARTNRAPDIIQISDDWMREFVDQGLLAPIDLGAAATQYIPFAIEAFTYYGALYGLPYGLESLTFVRNPELVPDQPSTWADVIAISRELRAAGRIDFGFMLPGHSGYHFFPVQSAFGGYLFRQRADGRFDPGDIGLNNAGSVAALEWLAGMIAENLTPPDSSYEDMLDHFAAGRLPMMILWCQQVRDLDALGVPYALSPFPEGTQPSRPFLHIQGFAVNAHGAHQDVARALLTGIMAKKSIMSILTADLMLVPAQVDVLGEASHPAIQALFDTAWNGQRFPDIPAVNSVWDPWNRAVQAAREGALDPETALNEAVAQIRETMREE
jgi:maltose/maltodextrin transport system substrate-binding protein/arabinogalactan oligomer/maltooligosaccharide transport system substrate-binding protein